MKTYTKQDFHNPEQLTRQQVGDEYRLLLSEEADGRFGCNGTNEAQCLESSYRLNWVGDIFGDMKDVTYRVPIATPLPDGTVISSNECCWSDEKPSDPRKVVYCCGPMSGKAEWNFPVFYSACAKLEKQGYKAINPAALDEASGYNLARLQLLTPDEFQVFLKGAMKRDLDALQQCDAIALLPEWESSKGARAEKAVAEWLGLEVMYLDGAEAPVEPEEVWEDSRYEYGNVPTYAPDDPKGAAGALKAPFHLLPPDALEEVAKVMGEGARKYKAWNFIEANVCASTYIGAIGRHWAAYSKGIDVDEESGFSHLAHLAANCLILLTAQQQGTLRDDRPKLRKI